MKKFLYLKIGIFCDEDEKHCLYQDVDGRYHSCKYFRHIINNPSCFLFGNLECENGDFRDRVLRHDLCKAASNYSEYERDLPDTLNEVKT